MLVMYHRIRNEEKSCSIRNFEKQVKFAKSIGAKLTFDDGLKEHYTVAFPILKKYNMVGTFFILTNSLNEIPTVHKVWILLEKYEDELIKELNITKKEISRTKSIYYKSEQLPTKNLKYYLMLNPHITEKYFKRYFNEKNIIKNFYMSKEEIQEIYDAGMEIGNHGHTHKIMTTLSEKEQEEEIKTSHEILKKYNPIGFSYPHGQYNDITIKLLKKYNYKYAVSTKSDELFDLRRIDTNEFK